MPHEIEYQLQAEIKRALAEGKHHWSAQEQCNAIIDQARLTAPLEDAATVNQGPILPNTVQSDKPKRFHTLLLLGILLVMLIIAIVAVSTLSSDQYDDEKVT